MSLIIAMSLFALSMSVSPGPVNLVTFSSGLNYGFLPSLPFVAGAALGFTLLLVVVGLGLGEIVALSPVLMQLLAYAGTAFICYMGYKIATAHPELPGAPERQPLAMLSSGPFFCIKQLPTGFRTISVATDQQTNSWRLIPLDTGVA
jgi:threonine/homoserine/homoserine lactone efflux protein